MKLNSRAGPYPGYAGRSTVMLLLVLMAACAGPGLKKEIIRDEPTFARPAAETGILADMAREIASAHGPEYSSFKLLDHSYDGLAWRLALIDSATDSLDIQSYLWYPDFSGRLVINRAVKAADRGVHVRLIVDDLLTIGKDQAIFELQRHPNIEFRLFNPWKGRSIMARAGEMVAEMERLNTRMHDKLVIADGRAAVVGGRNIGDHYFGLSEAYNFHDLDLLGFGEIAQQANGMFDHFWNSEWVVSAKNLDIEHDPEFLQERVQAVDEMIRTAPELESFPRAPADWTEALQALRPELHIGTSRLEYDQATAGAIDQTMVAEMFNFMQLAQEELLITNAYIIPSESSIEFVRGLTDRGVDVLILTNSLASHDVPAVNSHYREWRDDFIMAGAELFELRADAAIQSIVDVPPVSGEFTGLHTKAVVVDREQVFIGSMNFDPRSANINTEAGAFVHSPGLAQALADVMFRDMHPDNAWQVFLGEDGKPFWVNSDERVDKQPARGGTQRVMDKIFKIFPKEQY